MLRIMSTNKKNRILLYILFFVFNLSTVAFRTTAFFTDECNPFALAFMLKGYDLSDYLVADQYYYKYGQLLFELPVILFIHSHIWQTRIILAIHAAIVSFVPILVEYILFRYYKYHDYSRFIIALVVGSLPSVTLNAKLLWAEPYLIILPLLALVCLLKAAETGMVLYTVLLSLISCYAYMVHTRGIVLLLTTFLSVVFIRVIMKNKNIRIVIFLFTSFLFLIIEKYISNIVKSLIYTDKQVALNGGSLNFMGDSYFSRIFSVDGLSVLFIETTGWLFAIITATLGLFAVGCFLIFYKVIFSMKTKTMLTSPETICIFFGVVLFLGSAAMGELFFFTNIYEGLEGGIVVNRGDRLIYTRYVEPAAIIVSFIGLYYYFTETKMIKMKALRQAIICYMVTVVLYYYLIIPHITQTTIWPHVTMTLSYFCDYKGLKRNGMYAFQDELAVGVLAMGLFVFALLAIALVSQAENYKYAILLCVFFICCSYRGFFNGVYIEDKFFQVLDKDYGILFDLQESGNIYLEDEVIRSGIQFEYPSKNIITRRNKLDDYPDGFYLLYNGSDSKNYGILKQVIISVENTDYTLYVKGTELTQQLESQGYKLY